VELGEKLASKPTLNRRRGSFTFSNLQEEKRDSAKANLSRSPMFEEFRPDCGPFALHERSARLSTTPNRDAQGEPLLHGSTGMSICPLKAKTVTLPPISAAESYPAQALQD